MADHSRARNGGVCDGGNAAYQVLYSEKKERTRPIQAAIKAREKDNPPFVYQARTDLSRNSWYLAIMVKLKLN